MIVEECGDKKKGISDVLFAPPRVHSKTVLIMIYKTGIRPFAFRIRTLVEYPFLESISLTPGTLFCESADALSQHTSAHCAVFHQSCTVP